MTFAREERRVFYGLVAAFAIVALAFTAASIWTLSALRAIDEAGRDMLANALPSVTELMRVRSAQRNLDVDVAALQRTQGARPELLAEIDTARTAMGAALDSAMATPDYPGERELYEGSVKPHIAALDRSIGDLRTVAETRPSDDRGFMDAVARLDQAARQLDAQLAALAELNHAHAFEAASRIIGTREDVVRRTLYLDIGAAVLALAGFAFAVGAARAYARHTGRILDLETDRAKELDLIAQRVAHDLVSPLGAVSLSLGAIRRSHGDPGTSRAIDRALRALDRSRTMVQGIYAFSGSGARPVPGAVAPLRATLHDAVDALLAAEPDPHPTIDIEPCEEVEVAMERAVLDIVVSNLLSNAAKYTRGCAVRKVTVRCSVADTQVHVEVEDTGPGVPAGMEQTIFEPYRRAPGVTQPGLGLGLATVKRLVLAHGGNLGIVRAETGGATFWFDVPRAMVGREPAEEQGFAEGEQAHTVH